MGEEKAGAIAQVDEINHALDMKNKQVRKIIH